MLEEAGGHWLSRGRFPGERRQRAGGGRRWLVVPADAERTSEILAEFLAHQSLGERQRTVLVVSQQPPPDAAALTRLERALDMPAVALDLALLERLRAGPAAPEGPADPVVGGLRAEQEGAAKVARSHLQEAGPRLSAVDPDREWQTMLERRAANAFLLELRRAAPQPVATRALIAACVAVWLIQLLTGLDPWEPDPGALLAWGSCTPGLALTDQPWRLASSGFLHFGAVHLLVNLYVLYYLGELGERLFGRLRFGLIYGFALLMGCLASAASRPFSLGAVGASGAIFGLGGAALALVLAGRRDVPRLVFARLSRGLLLFVVLNLGLGLLISGSGVLPIDNAGHVGGLIGGAAAGLVLGRPPAAHEPGRAPTRLALGAALLLALSGGGWFAARAAVGERLPAARIMALLLPDLIALGQPPAPATPAAEIAQEARRRAAALKARRAEAEPAGPAGLAVWDATAEWLEATAELAEVPAGSVQGSRALARYQAAMTALSAAWLELMPEQPLFEMPPPRPAPGPSPRAR